MRMEDKSVNGVVDAPRKRAEWMELLGERLCLDFVNSPNWDRGAPRDDPFQSIDGFRVWTARAIGMEESVSARRLEDARRLRADMRLALLACIERRLVPDETMDRLGSAASRPRGLVYGWKGGKVVVTDDGDGEFGTVEVLAARSALELLMSTDRTLLKVCGGDRCGWLFLDRTRGLTRKWCMMRTCGNRAKAKAHYQKRRRAGSGAPDAPKR